ncbi:hypothetical protein HY419_02140, partial [candidate division WWE3 bacterium]|nr:hypothetical protein [candidate division WWE3 bacterium]
KELGFSDSIENVGKDETFTFRIKIENVGDLDGEDLEFKDELPDELKKISGALSEDIEVLDNGDEIVFCIEAQVEDDEFESGVNKCVINRAVLRGELDSHDGKDSISDEAVVCFGEKLKELPVTGSEDVILYTLYGLGLILIGLGVRRLALG